jgi:hypothetical protein
MVIRRLPTTFRTFTRRTLAAAKPIIGTHSYIHSVKLVLATLACLTAVASAGFTPVLTLVSPRGAQRGTEVEVTFSGDRMDDIQEVMFYEPGISVSNIQPHDGKKPKAKFTIAPDARLGEYSLRVRTASGVTELRSFYVGQFATLAEVEPNNSFDQPQKVELNTTVAGVADNEDEDFYIVSLKKGQRLSVEVEGMRLGRLLFDTYVAILDPKRFEIASCDDEPLVVRTRSPPSSHRKTGTIAS